MSKELKIANNRWKIAEDRLKDCKEIRKYMKGDLAMVKIYNKTIKEKVAKIIYEATRLEAEWSKRSIVPEKWENRDEKFKKQFVDIIDKYLSQDKLPTPEEAHNSWIEAYKKMGWKYGKKRDTVKKIHPDLLPFKKLPKDERDKDAIFLIIVWIIKKLI